MDSFSTKGTCANCVWGGVCVSVGVGVSLQNSHFRKMFVLSNEGTTVENKTLS